MMNWKALLLELPIKILRPRYRDLGGFEVKGKMEEMEEMVEGRVFWLNLREDLEVFMA
jgi:hypothetical protein